MRTLKYIGLTLLSGIYLSCSSDDSFVQEQEAELLNRMLTEIETLASSVTCSDASEWTFTDYGSKACGGPVGYIAYATTIDVDAFLQKVEAHKEAQEAFNRKWGIASDCLFPLPPADVVCENGMPVFVY